MTHYSDTTCPTCNAPPRHPLGGNMTTIYVRHDVTTIAEVNALALDEDQRENGAIVLYDGNTCYWSINWATRNEIPGRWYDNHRDGSRLVDGDEVTVLVPIEAEEEFGAGGDGMDEALDAWRTRALDAEERERILIAERARRGEVCPDKDAHWRLDEALAALQAAEDRDYQGDGWNSDAHDPEDDNPYKETP